MNNPQIFLEKDDPNIPDFYNIEIEFHGEKVSRKFEVASHEFVDKTYVPVFETASDGKATFKGMKPFGPHHAPYVEVKTTDDETLVFPLNGIKTIAFDKNWAKIVNLKNELEAKKEGLNEKSV